MSKIVLANLEDVNAVDQKIDTMVKPLYAEKSQTETGTSISPSNAKLIEKMDELYGKSEKGTNIINPSEIIDGYSITTANGAPNPSNERCSLRLGYYESGTVLTISSDDSSMLSERFHCYSADRIDSSVWLGVLTVNATQSSSGRYYKTITCNRSGYWYTPSMGNKNVTLSHKVMANTGNVPLDYKPYIGFVGIHSIEEINVKEEGKNLLDAFDMTYKGYYFSNGKLTANANWNAHYIPVVGGKTYTLSGASSIGANVYCPWFDENKNYLGNGIISSGVAPTNAKYIGVATIWNTSSASYDLDKAQLELGTYATQYAPYTEKSSLIPLASPLRGINDVRDRIYERTYKAMKSVDLGTMNWSYNTEFKQFRASLGDAVANGELVCPNYYGTKYAWDIPNMNMRVAIGLIAIKNEAYGTDANAFKTAMNGVILHYESTEGGEDYTTFVCENDTIQLTFDGTEGWEKISDGIFKTSDTHKETTSRSLCIADRYNYTHYESSISTLIQNGECGFNNAYVLHIRDDSISDVSALKNSLASKPLNLVCPIATPTITELSAEAIEVIRAIRNIDADHHLIVTDQYGNDVTYILTYLVEKATDNVVLVAPNGSRWKLTVSNTGALSAVAEN